LGQNLEILKNVAKYTLINLFLLTTLGRKLPYIKEYRWLDALRPLDKKNSILDIGCGTGNLLQAMCIWGFKNLVGIDPYIENDINYPSGVKILKTDIFKHNGNYDIIMAHHSFEHMDNPHSVFERFHDLVNPGGKILIRIPVSDSYAWRKYGVNWFQLDAPRHFFLHTVRSMSILAEKNKFRITSVIYDSTKLQFLMSEKYLRGKILNSAINFSYYHKIQCKKEANRLNLLGDGDQACFVLENT
jgi:SAM-dependent methyltransferase